MTVKLCINCKHYRKTPQDEYGGGNEYCSHESATVKKAEIDLVTGQMKMANIKTCTVSRNAQSMSYGCTKRAVFFEPYEQEYFELPLKLGIKIKTDRRKNVDCYAYFVNSEFPPVIIPPVKNSINEEKE